MQKTCEPSTEMLRYIEVKRVWVRDHYTPKTICKYDTVDGKLHLLNVILNANWIERNETVKLQNLGITLGDVIVQDIGFKWIQVEEDEEVDPALLLPGTSIIIYPLTMISKRIERGESVDIYKLYEGLKEKIEELKLELDCENSANSPI